MPWCRCSVKESSGLQYRCWWWAVGLGLVLVVVYLSLADIYVPQAPSTLGDKINHLIAYGVLCGWFGQLLHSWLSRMAMAFCLVMLGVLMELMQGLTLYRVFDLQDAVANTLGVLAGLLALTLGADNLLRWFEKRYLDVA